MALVTVLPAICRPALFTLPDFIPLDNGEPRVVDRGFEAGRLALVGGPRVDDGDVDILIDQRERVA